MQRNKYLDDLNIPVEEYGTNFVPDYDIRNPTWNKQREEYGFDSRECWNLDRTFIEWLYSRIMMYKEDASKIVDLSYHVIIFEDKEYTQEECIDYILEKLRVALLADHGNYDYKEVGQAIRMWADIFYACWW